ncbi:protein DpdH [Williamsia herbipolensis]|uniref:protein DpdH n=1 Tax=Williamsia herbipolensis TaxID=1603258 RepID=UPI0005F81FCC|nr:protein DpdH [Williamsia herbipolensis]
MSIQVNYTCWTSKNVTSTIPTEAATPSDAVLLATHAPLTIRRQANAVGDRETKFLTEREVLDEFLNADATNGVVVAPVLGASGAGKSHLIRWANARIPEKFGRNVVYLSKTQTSLKDVIEALLIGHHDSELDEIRRRVSTLGSGITLDEMEHKILAELAEALRTAKSDNPYGKALVGENGLRLFFTDPLFEKHLLRPGSFLKLRTKHALQGREADEPDVPLEFTIDELPLDIVDDGNIADAAAATRKLFGRLVASSQMQREAVRLLNEYLDVAVTKAATLNVGDIGQAFGRIREKLVGQEIVLLIEDVALIQGVRRDLLDAIIESGVVQGKVKYATVRTMMAVTEGYYTDLPDTFRTRAEASSPIYQVDVDLNYQRDESDQEKLFIDFFGRYLNAARVGKIPLEESTPEVPNACHACKFRASCHATFGTSGSGNAEYGLYPYNESAILRAIRACATRDGDRVSFNPRRVLSRAVRDVLNTNIDTIHKGLFPPANFLAEESISMRLPGLENHVLEKISSEYSEEDAGRVQSTLEYWGDAGSSTVSDDVVTAFSLPVLPSIIYQPPKRKPTNGSRESGGASGGQPNSNHSRSLQKRLDEIDAWSRGQILPQSTAAAFRKIIQEALVSRIYWYGDVIKTPASSILSKAVPDNSRGVSIEGANENIPLALPPIVRIDRSPRNAITLKGLALIQEGHVAEASDTLARLGALVAASVDEAKRRITVELAVGDDALVQAAASLIRGAAACGELAANSKDIAYVNACLWRDTSVRLDAVSRSPEWVSAYQTYVTARGKAVDHLMAGVGAAQGTGGVYAIDFVRLLAIVRKAKSFAELEDDLEVPEWCSDAQHKLKVLLRNTGRQLAFWKDVVTRIRAFLPEDVTFAETVNNIIECVEIGQGLGLVPVSDLQALQVQNADAQGWDARCVKDVERILVSAEHLSGTARLCSIGTVVGVDLLKILRYLESSSLWVDAGIRTAQSDVGTVADVDTQLDETMRTWLRIVKDPES